jgi:uncharacterized protein
MADFQGYQRQTGLGAGERAITAENAFLWVVYRWMTVGLALTGAIALLLPTEWAWQLARSGAFYALLVGELVLVLVFSWAARRINSATAIALFVAYAALNGLTFSVVFLFFEMSGIAAAFFVTAGTFGVTSAYGYFTKRSLSGVGHFAMMGLFGLILASVVNLFWANSTLYWVTTYAGVLIFVLLTAWDTQKIKLMGEVVEADSEAGRKVAIHGALVLYLDFINLFLLILRIVGGRR